MKNKNFPVNKQENNFDFLTKCSFCGSSFKQGDLTILEEHEQKTTFHMTCSGCAASAIVFLATNQTGVMSIGIATDLDKNEAKNKFSGNVISVDEIISVHQLIAENGNNFLNKLS